MYSNTSQENIKDYGIISLMYHRFEENKYPSTNIKINNFLKHLEIIQNNNIEFINPKNFEEELIENKNKRKILLTIDDGFSSFYKNAWPILKERKIPFILFVNTREVGSYNYMSWKEIKEISKEDFVEIGNHSHTHEYLVDESNDLIKSDIQKSSTEQRKSLLKLKQELDVLSWGGEDPEDFEVNKIVQQKELKPKLMMHELFLEVMLENYPFIELLYTNYLNF